MGTENNEYDKIYIRIIKTDSLMAHKLLPIIYNFRRHLYENRSCETSANNVSSQTAPGSINGVKRSSKKDKRDGFSQT